MSDVYTIKYCKIDGNNKITISDNGAELAAFQEGDPDFKGIVDSIPAFKDLDDGMELTVTKSLEDFNSEYSLDLDFEGESEEEESAEGSEGDTEINIGGEGCEKCGKTPCECEGGGELDAEHLATDAKHLSDIEARVADIEATLSNISSAFTNAEEEVGADAEAIETTVETMEDEDSGEASEKDGDTFTDAEVPDFAGSGGDVESVSYSGSRVWEDPASEFTDSSDAVSEKSDESEESEEKEEKGEESDDNSDKEKDKKDLEESYYEMYDEDFSFTSPKKKLGKFKL